MREFNPFQHFSVDTNKLNIRLISRLVGLLLLALGLLMLLPVGVSAWEGEKAVAGLGLSSAIMIVGGGLLSFVLGRNAHYNLPERDSFWVTTVVWLVVPLAGVLPFLLTGAMHNFTDAAFESISGFTTTGASVVERPELLPKGLLLWRGLTQWLGGLGLILLVIAAVDNLKDGGYRLYEAEFSGTVQKKLHPHISKSVSLMWRIYVGMTLVLLVGLMVMGNDFVESLCLSLSTISTGGFVTRSTGLAHLGAGSLALIVLFMFESGINVALVYLLVTGRGGKMWRDEEFRAYVGTYLVAVATCVWGFVAVGNAFGESLGFSLFHVASTLSTCGFYMDSPAHWSMWVSVLTFLMILLGASAGSSGGGIKFKRVIILMKYVRNFFMKMLHPNAVFAVKMDGKRVADDYINKIFGFVFLFFLFVMAGAFVLTLCGVDIPNAVCMAATNISNLGPSPLINSLGANMNYQALPDLAKWTLMVLMLAGRLEIFALVAVFMPTYWKRT